MTQSREPSVQPRPTNAGQEVSFNQQGENMSKNKNSNRPKNKPKQLLLTLRIDEPLMDYRRQTDQIRLRKTAAGRCQVAPHHRSNDQHPGAPCGLTSRHQGIRPGQVSGSQTHRGFPRRAGRSSPGCRTTSPTPCVSWEEATSG